MVNTTTVAAFKEYNNMKIITKNTIITFLPL